jgi:hypothetical protein
MSKNEFQLVNNFLRFSRFSDIFDCSERDVFRLEYERFVEIARNFLEVSRELHVSCTKQCISTNFNLGRNASNCKGLEYNASEFAREIKCKKWEICDILKDFWLTDENVNWIQFSIATDSCESNCG